MIVRLRLYPVNTDINVRHVTDFVENILVPYQTKNQMMLMAHARSIMTMIEIQRYRHY